MWHIMRWPGGCVHGGVSKLLRAWMFRVVVDVRYWPRDLKPAQCQRAPRNFFNWAFVKYYKFANGLTTFE